MPFGSLKAKFMSEKYREDIRRLEEYKTKLNISSNPNYKEFTGKHLIIMICSDCNIKCKHCYISYTGNRTPDELVDMLKILKDKYVIELNGAEVLTNLDYLKAYKIIGQHHLITNGKAILDNPETIDKLHDNEISTVALSYHFGIQDELSPIKEEDLNEIIRRLQESEIEVRLMTTINTNNYYKIREMCERASELGSRAIKFTNFIDQGNAQYIGIDNTLTEKEKRIFFEQLYNERNRYDIDDLLIERCGTFGKNTYLPQDNFECISVKDSVVLTPDNNIYPCVFLAKPGYEIGKFVDDKVYIEDELKTDSTKCLTEETCNKKLVYKIGRG